MNERAIAKKKNIYIECEIKAIVKQQRTVEGRSLQLCILFYLRTATGIVATVIGCVIARQQAYIVDTDAPSDSSRLTSSIKKMEINRMEYNLISSMLVRSIDRHSLQICADLVLQCTRQFTQAHFMFLRSCNSTNDGDKYLSLINERSVRTDNRATCSVCVCAEKKVVKNLRPC